MPPSAIITLKGTTREDLEALFHFQRDPHATYLAAFTSPNPGDQPAYLAKHAAFLTDPTITMRTIKANDALVGSIAKFERAGEAEVTYWLDRTWWGQGIATQALAQFLEQKPSRPLYGRVALTTTAPKKYWRSVALSKSAWT